MSTDTCLDKYYKFVDSGDKNILSGCYDVVENSNISPKSNPLDKKERCVLINSKKTNYYKHRYQPHLPPKLSQDILSDIDKIFDLTPKDNCCNCIAISLYFTAPEEMFRIIKYLSSIKRTIQNVKKNLPEWLVRIYLDSSVEKSMNLYEKMDIKDQKILDTIHDLLHYIKSADNVEVYSYFCKEIISGQISINRTRTFRFLPFTEPDVNICIIRDADGIVTNLDCHNIRVFEKSQTIFYFSEVDDGYNHRDGGMIYTSYSVWLSHYKTYMEREYFSKRNNLYDILAGTFAIKLQVKEDYYVKSAQLVQEMIDKDADQTDREKLTETIRRVNILGTSTIVDRDFLNTGYDEILLLHMFRDLISPDIKNTFNRYLKPDNYNQAMLSEMLSYIYANHNIQNIFYPDIDIISIDEDNCIDKIGEILTRLSTERIIITISIDDITAKVQRFIDEAKQNQISLNDVFLIMIDSFLTVKNIITENMFNIRMKSRFRATRLSDLINKPYAEYSLERNVYFNLIKTKDFIYSDLDDRIVKQGGGYYQKYIKYKLKYLSAKSQYMNYMNMI